MSGDVDAALTAFYRAHILRVYHTPKKQAEYLTGQRLRDGRESWREPITAAVAAIRAESAGLDVDRLARALTEVQGGAYKSWVGRSPAIAAEYARLTEAER